MKNLTCPRCEQLYSAKFYEHTGQLRHPLLLRCGHTFCIICIQKLKRKDESIKCPTCQTITSIGKGGGLYKTINPDLYTVGRMWMKRMNLEIQSQKISGKPVTKVKRKEGRPTDRTAGEGVGIRCSECQVQAAVCQCIKCEGVMCSPCFDKIHQRSYTLQKHKQVGLIASVYGAADSQRNVRLVRPRSTSRRTCPSHDQCHIEYYCEDDRQTICSRCVIMGDHKGHNVQTMEDKNQSLLAEMEPAVLETKETLWRLEKSEKVLKESMDSVSQPDPGLTSVVRDHFSHLHSMLQAREEQLLDEIKESSHTTTNAFQEMKDHLQSERLNLEEALMDAACAKQGSLHRVVDADITLERLQKAKDLPCVITIQKEAVNNPLKFAFEENMKDLIGQYGKVSVADAGQLFSLTPAAPEAEKPPTEELRSYSVADMDLESASSTTTTDSASLTGSTAAVEDDKNDSGEEAPASAEVMKTQPLSFPPTTPLPVGNYQLVTVTHICTPAHFYVQLASQADSLVSLQRSMNGYCRSAGGRKNFIDAVETVPGTMVVAQYAVDKQWYRGQVQRIVTAPDAKGLNGLYEICFVDFGNSAELRLAKMRKIPTRFLTRPIFAHECGLFDILPKDENLGWTRESVDAMLEMTVGSSLQMMALQKVGGRLDVDLGRLDKTEPLIDGEPVSVRDGLVFLDLAVFNARSPHGPVTMKKRDYLTQPAVDEGTIINIGINCVHSPSSFQAQCYNKQCHRHLHQLLTSMQATYSKATEHLYRIFCPKIDMICMARYARDNNWYRARVTGLPGNGTVRVQYVDYGNSEVVSHSDICKILDDHIKYPMQALEVSLVDIEPVGNDWSQEARNWFRSVAELQLCQFRVTKESEKPNSLTGVLYTVNSDTHTLCCINYELVKQGYAQSTGLWSLEHSFIGVNLNPEILLESQRQSPASSSSESSCTSPISGPYHVGSPLTLTLASPPPAFPKPSPQAGGKTVASSSPRPAGPASPSPHQGAGAEGKAVVVVVPQWRDDGELGVGETWKKGGDLVAVQISGYSSPSEFFVQLLEKRAELARLVQAMQGYGQVLTLKPCWKAGEWCAAKSVLDGRWYRGLVTHIRTQEDLLEVKLVDYGHVELLPPANLRPLQNAHAQLSFFAERCHISDLVPSGTTDRTKWSKTATEFVSRMIGPRDVYIRPKGQKVPELGLPVDLVVEDVIEATALEPAMSKYTSVSAKLEDKGLAIPLRRRKTSESDSQVTPSAVEMFTESATVVCEDLSGKEDNNDDNEDEDDNQPASEKGSESGEVAEAVDPDLVVAPHPPPLSPRLRVVPLFVDSEGIVYAQDVEEAETFKNMTVVLQKHCEEEEESAGSREGRLKVKDGQLCLAFCTAYQIWLRARVVKVHHKQVEVKFLDYGQTAVVTNSHKGLRHMTPEWCVHHQLVYELRLPGVGLGAQDGSETSKAVELLNSTIVNTCYTAVIQGSTEERPLLVELVDVCDEEEKDVDDNEGKATTESPGQDMDIFYQWSNDITDILKLPSPYASLKLGEKGDIVHAVVSHLELPNVVFLQRCESPTDGHLPQSLVDFVELMEALNDLPPQTPALEDLPAPSTLCCARYTADHRWYRALVLKPFPKERLVFVLYVDYGNSEIIPLDRLRVLPSRFQGMAAQSVRALLNVTLPKGCTRWTMGTYQAMDQSIYTVKHRVLIKETMPLTVELYWREGEMILSYADLVQQGMVVVPQQDEDPCTELTGEESSLDEEGTSPEDTLEVD
ncbi:hypothetical protein ACOMHN_025444 [Nucella lapillus]